MSNMQIIGKCEDAVISFTVEEKDLFLFPRIINYSETVQEKKISIDPAFFMEWKVKPTVNGIKTRLMDKYRLSLLDNIQDLEEINHLSNLLSSVLKAYGEWIHCTEFTVTKNS